MNLQDYIWLLEGLDETQEQLRKMRIFGRLQQIQIAWASWRVAAAAAAIRSLLTQVEELKSEAAMSCAQALPQDVFSPSQEDPVDQILPKRWRAT